MALLRRDTNSGKENWRIMSVSDLTLYNMVERSAIVHGEKTALVEDETRVTYSQLKKMVDSVAAGLIESEGVNPGDRIAVLAVNSVEYLVLYLAAARAGAILVPINFRLSPEAMRFIIEDTSPVLFFVQPEFHEVLAKLSGKLSCVQSLYSTSEGTGTFKGWAELVGREDSPDPVADIGTDTPIVIFYTAATSGSPWWCHRRSSAPFGRRMSRRAARPGSTTSSGARTAP